MPHAYYPNPNNNLASNASPRSAYNSAQQFPPRKSYFIDKRVVITGASSGLGNALAYWYLNQGAQVVLVGKDEEALKKTASEFTGQATVVICNLLDDYECRDLVEACKARFKELDRARKAQAGLTTVNKDNGKEEYQPKLDILINCAAVIFAGDMDTTFPQDFDYLQDLNVRAPYVLINFFQDMLIAGQGCVVNMSCIKGSKPQPGLIGYCMAKAGLEMVTKSAALELARFGVRVNCVSCSYINTNLYRTAGLTEAQISSIMDKEADTNPMGRGANIEEVCQAIIHLTSQHSRMMTG